MIRHFYFIRHAEKRADDGFDPQLTNRGLDRAENYVKVFEYVPLKVIYATYATRVQQTVAPVSVQKQIPVTNYRPADFHYIYSEILSHQNWDHILIGGHQNTVPEMVNLLIDQSIYQELNEDQYDQLFTVVMDGDKCITHHRLRIPLIQ